MYDITNYSTFDDLEEWLDIVKEVTEKHKDKDHPKPHLALVGNKGMMNPHLVTMTSSLIIILLL